MAQREKENQSAKKPLNKFRISSALKNLIGKELITDDYIAVFELIKNSYDAGAREVKVVFEKDKIIIQDDGSGMDVEDIRNKWLFVGYSSKVEKEKQDRKVSLADYRNNLSPNRQIAGAKGVGRFSCDRLGQHLILETKTRSTKKFSHRIEVDWGDFEADPKREFVDIKIRYAPRVLSKYIHEHGTVLVISSLRSGWDRMKILGLRHHLQRLIHPNEATSQDFRINIIAENEKARDIEEKVELDKEFRGEIPDTIIQRKIVNGEVKNLLFDSLGIKTTRIQVEIKDGKIETVLNDRGSVIYRIRRENTFSYLNGTSASIFYLNRSAKLNFHKIMGIPNVQFGSVFLFRNGFRVYPIGEKGDDSFGIDLRRGQGFARHLGTRDILGHIYIQDPSENFKESTSRDGGLIRSEATRELDEFFLKHCLIPLENYVVGALWKIKDDKDVEDIRLLLNDPSKARVIDIVSKLVKDDDVEIVEYNRDLLSLVQDKFDRYIETLEGLKRVAEKSRDKELIEQIRLAEEKYRALKDAEQKARRELEKEKEARREAERKAKVAEQEKQALKEDLKKEKETALFLKSVQSLDADIVINLHHQIGICSSTIEKALIGASLKLERGVSDPKAFLGSLIENISFENRKIMAVTKFATRANFVMESETITKDLIGYISQYLRNVQPIYGGSGLAIEVHEPDLTFKTKFKPIEIVILLDNLISNSRKAEANKVVVKLELPSQNSLRLRYSDNGKGLSPSIRDARKIFEKGFTTTPYGSGLGLYHVAQIISAMGGEYSVLSSEPKGFVMEVIFRK